MNAKNKLLASIGILIISIVTIISVLSYNQINSSSTNSYQTNLSTSTHLITSAVEQKIQTYFTSLEATASAIVVNNQTASIDNRMVEMLVQGTKSLGVSNYFIALPDGTLYDSDSKGLHPTFNAKKLQREWYVKAMSGQDQVVTKPFKASTGQMSISLVIPVKRNGEVVAIVGLSLLMNDLTRFINGLAEDSNVFVAREDGYLMAAYEEQLVGEDLFELRPTYKQYASDASSSHSYMVPDRGEFYVVSERSKALGWTVWAFASWEDIKATSREAVITNLVSGLVFIIIGTLGASLLIQKLLYNPIGGEPKEIERLVDKIANGDLTDIPAAKGSDIGVYRSTLLMADKLKTMITDINLSSEELIEASSKLERSSIKVDGSSKSQMMQLEQVATAMNEMTATVAEVAQSAVEASSSSSDANNSSEQGLTVVAQMNSDITMLVNDINQVQQVIRNVHTETENVGGILDVIRGIADQTNLLALNAAIEAARAGEHGRGFAVVADEVRSLATKTQQSTNEIQSMIEVLQEQANKSVLLMQDNSDSAKRTLDKAGEATLSLDQIRHEIQRIQDMNHQIATAAEEQSQVAHEINESVINVNDLARDTTVDVQDNVDTSEALIAMSNKLRDSVSMFKLN
ncbi:methyl-accepting chemotaxis protein [Vibrio rotiferianus]|uniref:methyl-accepting chemotaxis protein n=1 Tax=Vibrio rotiferianus TaxID=190895 RepID=UPI0028947AA0|nr:Methyl-accepting chemotaxis protein [Vibrio rotiferianus]